MIHFRFSIGVTLLLLALSVGQLQAEESWWQKGIDILKTESDSTGELSTGEIGKALKQALQIGSERVVDNLGAVDGFNADPDIHIPLPGEFQNVKTMLGRVGMSEVVDDLELKLNRAAEAATPKAKNLFLQSIKEMTFEDVRNIYEGPDDSATLYFKEKMSGSLADEMRPIVENSMAQVGAVQAYDTMMGKSQTLPFVPNVKANLTDHVVQKGLDGIFHYVAKEEAAIRNNPVQQSTALLKKVFGSQ